MNNFSPHPVSASDSRLPRPEAAAPNVPSPALQARRQKLRRIVAGVVGGATLLMFVGLVSAAIRSHSDSAPDAVASPASHALVASPTQAPSTTTAPAVAAPDPAATQAALIPAPPATLVSGVAAKAAKKASLAHATKPVAKTAKRTTVAKSAAVRH